MTHTQKIIGFITFMLFVTLIVFTWFSSQLFCHMKDFKETTIQKRTQLQIRMEKEVEDLHKRRKGLREEVDAHFKNVNEKLHKRNQEMVEGFQKFQEKQDAFFDEIGAIISTSKKEKL